MQEKFCHKLNLENIFQLLAAAETVFIFGCLYRAPAEKYHKNIFCPGTPPPEDVMEEETEESLLRDTQTRRRSDDSSSVWNMSSVTFWISR